MIASLSPAARRALAFALLALAILAGAAAVAAPAVLWRHYETELATVERHVADLQAQVPARERLLQEERRLGTETAERSLLRGSTPGVAAAQLQGDLTALASAMGAAVASVQILDPEPADAFTDIGLRLTMTADISTLRDFLYAVEARDPILLVRAFSLSPRRAQRWLGVLARHGAAHGDGGGAWVFGGRQLLRCLVRHNRTQIRNGRFS